MPVEPLSIGRFNIPWRCRYSFRNFHSLQLLRWVLSRSSLGIGTLRSCERALLQEIFSSGKPRPLHPSRFIFLTLPTEIQHRNKNSINVKLTKTGTGCLRCTPPCSGVRRQAMMGVPLQAMIHGAWASIRPTAEPRAGAVCWLHFCTRSSFLLSLRLSSEP